MQLRRPSAGTLPVGNRGRTPAALTRRGFLALTGQVTVAGVLAGCGGKAAPAPPPPSALTARPAASVDAKWPGPSTGPLGIAKKRDFQLHIPLGLTAGQPVPLVVMLHGARMNATEGLNLLLEQSDDNGFVLLAAASRGKTWDAIADHTFGPDVDMINRALTEVFSMIPVDPAKVALAGFSDGASYALGLGLANGTLFPHVIAFSPGELPKAPRVGKPPIFIAHGDADAILPIEVTREKIVPALRTAGYDVTYQEFSGLHAVVPKIADEAIHWLNWGDSAH